MQPKPERVFQSDTRRRLKLFIAMPTVWTCFLLIRPLSLAVAQHHIDSWSTDNGLPHNSVRALVQTRDGYLWLGTADGLVRFDGVQFTTFNRENSPGMTGNRITALLEDNDGDLWMGSDGAVMRLHNRVFSSYGSESGVPNGWVGDLTLDLSGDPLILLIGGVMRWHQGRLETLKTGSVPVSSAVTHYPKSSGFWRQNARAIEINLQGRLISWEMQQQPSGFGVRAVAEDEHGVVWAAGIGKLFRHQNGRLAPVPIPAGCSPAEDISFIAAPELKVVCYGAGLPLVTGTPDGGEQQRLIDSLPPSLEPHSPTAFYQDREGILWMGTSVAGLWRIRRQAVVTLSSGQGLRDHHIYPIYQDHTGAIWIGAWPNTLNRYQDRKFQYFTARDGLVPYFSSLYEDRSGTLWVGAYGADRHDAGEPDLLRVFKNGRFVAPAGLSSLGPVRAIVQDRRGALWLGCEYKLVRYDKGMIRSFTTGDGLATNFATVLVEDHSGNLWIGGQGGLTRLSGGRFTAFTVRDGLT